MDTVETINGWIIGNKDKKNGSLEDKTSSVIVHVGFWTKGSSPISCVKTGHSTFFFRCPPRLAPPRTLSPSTKGVKFFPASAWTDFTWKTGNGKGEGERILSPCYTLHRVSRKLILPLLVQFLLSRLSIFLRPTNYCRNWWMRTRRKGPWRTINLFFYL